jgi:23S rRNA pseudouridine1911/1915/1917 synthase
VLKTGRTHQIRAHLKSLNHAIVGDELYGGVDKAIKTNGQLLFAYKIKFVHPTTNESMCFEAELPNNFNTILEKLR